MECQELFGHVLRRRNADLRKQDGMACLVRDDVEIQTERLQPAETIWLSPHFDEPRPRMGIGPMDYRDKFHPRYRVNVPPYHASTQIELPDIERMADGPIEMRREELRRFDRNMIEVTGC